MARIDANRLVNDVAVVGRRVGVVAQDPAVQKSWKLAAEDTARAYRSIIRATHETGAAWYRSGNPYGFSAAPIR